MQTPYFTEGQTEPVDPTNIVRDEKSGQKNGKGESDRKEDEGQMYAPMQKEPVDPTESTGHHTEQNSGFSGVRKILHPAEALDSARHTAELIMKDAMDALIRTKQRLMEILPSLMPSQANNASKVVENVEQDMLGKAEGAVPHPETNGSDEKPSEVLASNASGGIPTNATLGDFHQSSSDLQSRKNSEMVGVSKL